MGQQDMLDEQLITKQELDEAISSVGPKKGTYLCICVFMCIYICIFMFIILCVFICIIFVLRQDGVYFM